MNPLLIILNLFATVLFVYSVIAYEPPAFIAYLFGTGTGFTWSAIFVHWVMRKSDEDNDRD